MKTSESPPVMKKIKTWIKRHPQLKRAVLWCMNVLAPVSRRPLAAIPRYSVFLSDWRLFRRAGGTARILDFYPCLDDKTLTTAIDSHYFYQAVWGFRKIHESGTHAHIDVGSQAAFVGMLTAITQVTFIDIRPMEVTLDGYTSRKGSILALPLGDNTVPSLSCLHVVEHIGLGRYGDPIDPEGPIKACQELERVLAPGGNLYFSLPIGKPRVCFNAHRIHSTQQICSYFGRLKLVDFSIVDDHGRYHRDVSPHIWDELDYGCGMFHFRK